MVEADELLREWPSWRKTSADKVLASPAWRMDVAFARTKARVTIDPSGMEEDMLYLRVALDSGEHVLGLADSARFPDLHRLWSRLAALDGTIVLALIEKECGTLFLLLEQVFGRELRVVGLAEGRPEGMRTVFQTADFRFSLDLSSDLRLTLGDLSLLDPSHASIRQMTRPARAEYLSFALAEAKLTELAAGDLVPLGADCPAHASWSLEAFADDRMHVVDAQETELRFADFADGTLPAPGGSTALLMLRGSRVVAEGEWTDLGGMPCFKLTRMRS